MLSLRSLVPIAFAVLLPTIQVAYPQSTATKVRVGDTDYSVTPMSRGRMLRVDDLDGHLIGMASVNGADISILAPQQEPGFSIVKSAANAYLHPSNGAAPPAAATNDAMAAQRSALLNRMATLRTSAATAPGASDEPPSDRIVFPAGGGAVVKGTPFGDITYSADGTEARAVQKTVSPIVGSTKIELIAKYEGGDSASGGKAASTIGGGAKVLLESENVRAKGTINTRGNDVIRVSQSTNGGKDAEILTTGDKHVSQSEYTARDLNAGNKQRGDGFLSTAYQGLKDAMDEAAKKRSAGESVAFDPSGTAAGQNALKEYARYEAK